MLPPRPRGEGIISRLLWERTVVSGLVMAAGTLLMFWWELETSENLPRAQTVALTTMGLFQVFHVGNCRQGAPPRPYRAGDRQQRIGRLEALLAGEEGTG